MPSLTGSTRRPRFPIRDMATVAFLSAAVWKLSQKVRWERESSCFKFFGCHRLKGTDQGVAFRLARLFFLAPRLIFTKNETARSFSWRAFFLSSPARSFCDLSALASARGGRSGSSGVGEKDGDGRNRFFLLLSLPPLNKSTACRSPLGLLFFPPLSFLFPSLSLSHLQTPPATSHLRDTP